MKKVIILLLVFVGFTAYAEETECPPDGLYETTGKLVVLSSEQDGMILGRIAVLKEDDAIYVMFDDNEDGLLENEETEKNDAEFYYDKIRLFVPEDSSSSVKGVSFVYSPENKDYRMIVKTMQGTVITIYKLIEEW